MEKFLSLILILSGIISGLYMMTLALRSYETKRLKRAKNWEVEMQKKQSFYENEPLQFEDQIMILNRFERTLKSKRMQLHFRKFETNNVVRIAELENLIEELETRIKDIQQYRLNLIEASRGGEENRK